MTIQFQTIIWVCVRWRWCECDGENAQNRNEDNDELTSELQQRKNVLQMNASKVATLGSIYPVKNVVIKDCFTL